MCASVCACVDVQSVGELGVHELEQVGLGEAVAVELLKLVLWWRVVACACQVVSWRAWAGSWMSVPFRA